MKAKNKRSIKQCRDKSCCAIIKQRKDKLEEYLTKLIDSELDFEKNKWSWGILQIIEDITESLKREKFCQSCKSYISGRKRLAELIIVATNR